MPVQAPTRATLFYGYSKKPPYLSRLLRRAWGYGGPILILNPESPRGNVTYKIMSVFTVLKISTQCPEVGALDTQYFSLRYLYNNLYL